MAAKFHGGDRAARCPLGLEQGRLQPPAEAGTTGPGNGSDL
jgi:hypothetical protein